MATASKHELATTALRISLEMLNATENDSWEDLETLDVEREQVIGELFDGLDPTNGDNVEWEGLLWEIQRINDEVLTRVLGERERVGRELAQFRRGQKADVTYLRMMNTAE